jgi:D-alanyl-lipoteichoic acid acyltransferase DltB (MBOAT superfamily)
MVAFAFQIYCDFSGYSDIAIGAAQVMGFDLMKNFDRPYTARSIAEFWRRWHISLSTWFRDYLYIPLGGNRVARPRWYVNLFITFLVSGLWHGARWTFVVWGALHGAYLILALVSGDARARIRGALGLDRHPTVLRIWQTTATFSLVGVAWVFFRATSLGDAWYVLTHLATGLGPQLSAIAARDPVAIGSLLFLGFEPSKLVLSSAAVAADRPRQWIGYASPSSVRATYHQSSTGTGADVSVSWTRDLISSNNSSTKSRRSSNQADE